jgi:hypothetical protein
MTGPRPHVQHGPQLDATEARQSRPAPSLTFVLVASTLVAALVVAIIWAVFAGPLHHAPNKPQVNSPDQAAGFSQPLPQAKMQPSPQNTGAPNGGQINNP